MIKTPKKIFISAVTILQVFCLIFLFFKFPYLLFVIYCVFIFIIIHLIYYLIMFKNLI